MAIDQIDYGDKALKVRSIEVLEGLYGDGVSSVITRVEKAQTDAFVVRAKLDSFIAAIASDNRLTVVEKREMVAKFADIMVEEPRIIQRALDVNIANTDPVITSYSSAYDALSYYLYTDPGPLLNMTSTTEVVGSVLIGLWNDYVTTREALLAARDTAANAIASALADEIAQRARFFYGATTPVGPYDIGDFWVTDEAIYTAVVARGEGESNILDWEWYIRPNLMVVIESTNGTMFKPGQTTVTSLIAHVFRNGLEITSEISETRFRWRRASFYPLPPPDDDATWNSNHSAGYKVIEVTAQDIYARATYFCDILE